MTCQEIHPWAIGWWRRVQRRPPAASDPARPVMGVPERWLGPDVLLWAMAWQPSSDGVQAGHQRWADWQPWNRGRTCGGPPAVSGRPAPAAPLPTGV
jgi:hypothetical protein